MNFTGYGEEAVDLAVDLVNTYNAHRGTDNLGDPGALDRFLDDRGKGGRTPATPDDLDEVRSLRALLRSIFEARDDRVAAENINRLLAESAALPRLTDHGGSGWHLHYTTPDVPIARELAAVTAMGLAVLMAEGRWDRIHICAGDRCLDVFVDMSKNRSRRYCSPGICGNRASVAAYRRRARAGR